MGKECKATHIQQDSEEAILFLTHSLSLFFPLLSAAEGMWPWYLKTRSPIWPPDITSHHPITIYPRSQNATNTGGANQSPLPLLCSTLLGFLLCLAALVLTQVPLLFFLHISFYAFCIETNIKC